MEYEDYLEFVKSNWNASTRPHQDQVIHAAMGLSGEAGEVLEWHKKTIFHNRDLPKEALVSEFGDVLYYLVRLATLYGVSLEEIMDVNVDKINNRKATRTGAYEKSK